MKTRFITSCGYTPLLYNVDNIHLSRWNKVGRHGCCYHFPCSPTRYYDATAWPLWCRITCFHPFKLHINLQKHWLRKVCGSPRYRPACRELVNRRPEDSAYISNIWSFMCKMLYNYLCWMRTRTKIRTGEYLHVFRSRQLLLCKWSFIRYMAFAITIRFARDRIKEDSSLE